ncbi:hypothetical protein LSCM4_04170 [Leishmania orientalis]|uniref:Uncharacterized protein n=1 Tax=Leishmania orientalis TaxID=2249476 RepID=A0A836HF25_9TRYP|nr:hypothetical protein LSCM4_04170 [Leishmania orientalis]
MKRSQIPFEQRAVRRGLTYTPPERQRLLSIRSCRTSKRRLTDERQPSSARSSSSGKGSLRGRRGVDCGRLSTQSGWLNWMHARPASGDPAPDLAPSWMPTCAHWHASTAHCTWRCYGIGRRLSLLCPRRPFP